MSVQDFAEVFNPSGRLVFFAGDGFSVLALHRHVVVSGTAELARDLVYGALFPFVGCLFCFLRLGIKEGPLVFLGTTLHFLVLLPILLLQSIQYSG